MASFLNASLPSEDEEDDFDYRPEVDKTAEVDDRKEYQAAVAVAARKRRRRYASKTLTLS
jgi:hypothetical protein